MTHRTMDFGAGPVEVFDSSLAAMRWAKRHKDDCRVLARGKLYFMRKDGHEMTIRLNATVCDQNRHVLEAANNIAYQIEDMIERESRNG